MYHLPNQIRTNRCFLILGKVPSPRKHKPYDSRRNEFFDCIDSTPKFAPKKLGGSATTSFEEVVKAVIERKNSNTSEKRVSFESDKIAGSASPINQTRKNSVYDSRIKSESSIHRSGKDSSLNKAFSAEDRRFQPFPNTGYNENVYEDDSSVATTSRQLEDLSPDEPLEDGVVETISGTLFRKVTVKRRRQEMKKAAAIDNGKSSFSFTSFNAFSMDLWFL